jgi:hypothetical protein
MLLTTDPTHRPGAAWQRSLSTLLLLFLLLGCKQPTPQEACAQAVQQLALSVANGVQFFQMTAMLMAVALLAILLADLYGLKRLKILAIVVWFFFWFLCIIYSFEMHQSVGSCTAAGQLILRDGIPLGWIDVAVIGGGLLLVFALQPVGLGHGAWIAELIEERAERRRAAQEQAHLRLLERQEANRLAEQDLQNRRRNVAEQLSGIENAIRAAEELKPFEVKRQVNLALDRIAANLDNAPLVMTEPLRQRAKTAAASLERAGSMDASFKTRWQQQFGIRI